MAVFRIQQLAVQARFIAEKKQTFRIRIQSSQGVNLFWKTEFREGAVRGAVGGELGKNPVGLVKGQQHD